MKKITLILTILIFALSAGFTSQRLAYNGKVYDISKITGQVNYLLAKHETFLKHIFSKKHISTFAKGFFRYTGFMNENTTQNFFRNLEYRIKSGNAPGAKNGVTMISYTSVVSINGETKAVSYSYSSNGKNIQLIKQTYNKGTLLKAQYEYNINGKLLKVREYKNNELINNKNHKLLI